MTPRREIGHDAVLLFRSDIVKDENAIGLHLRRRNDALLLGEQVKGTNVFQHFPQKAVHGLIAGRSV